MEITLLETKYKVVKNEKEGFDKEEVEKRFDEFFLPYDVVVGDWAYGKLRLKGFNKKENKNFKPINDASKVDDYIKNSCAYGCRHFVMEKIK